MKNSIKRAQSQARLSFAERENQRSLAGGESNFRPKVKQLKKSLLTLVALLAVTTGAWATEFTSLKVGDVLHVGDVINTSTNYMVCGGSLDANFQPATVVRGNIVIGSMDVTESETGAYYLLKTQIGVYAGVISGPLGNEGGSWPVTDTSDGIVVTAIAPADYGYTELTFAVHEGAAAASTGPKVAWDKDKKTGKFTMPGGNVTLEPEYYPQAALTAVPTAINDVPATTDGAIVKAGTVANIGETTAAQGTVMYYVSTTALDDAALLALAADKWTADVPTAEKLTKGEAHVYYYVRGNDSDTDEENFSDGDILAANALTVTIAAEPTKVTMAVNDKTMGTAEVCGQSKVEWTADTWSGWNTGKNTEMTKSDGGITMTYTNDAARPYDGMIMDYGDSHVLDFLINEYIDDCTVTFSSDEGNISRIELSMTEEYSEETIPGTTYTYGNPHILPLDGWTFNGKSAVWEGEATKSLTLQSCSTEVSKITFFKEAIPEGVIVNTDGTFTVAKTATVKLTATPKEGYKFLYWDDDPTNTNPVREVTIEPGEDDMTYKAVFAEILYNVTFAEGTDPKEWTASPDAGVTKGETVTVTYTGSKKVIGVKAEKKAKAPAETTVTLTTGEIGDLFSWDSNSKTINGITIAVSGDACFHLTGLIDVHGDAGPVPDPDQVYAVGTFTFTSSAGKIKRIDINHNNGGLWYGAGEGWPGSYQVYDNSTFTWSGIPAASVTLNGSHKGFENCALSDVSSIVFTIEPTN